MTESKSKLQDRHDKAFKALKEAAAKKDIKGKNTQIFALIGAKLDISGQTVINYLAGDYKDGYLTEAITKEFKKLKLN